MNDLLAILILVAVVIGVLWGIVSMIRTPKRGSGIASLTAMHDLQTREKQNAMEYVMEAKSEKKTKEQGTGSTE